MKILSKFDEEVSANLMKKSHQSFKNGANHEETVVSAVRIFLDYYFDGIPFDSRHKLQTSKHSWNIVIISESTFGTWYSMHNVNGWATNGNSRIHKMTISMGKNKTILLLLVWTVDIEKYQVKITLTESISNKYQNIKTNKEENK